MEKITSAYDAKRKLEDPERLEGLERNVVVNAVDVHWQDHLTEMDELRRSVGLRGYGQKDPLSEYKNEAFRAFEEMMGAMRSGRLFGDLPFLHQPRSLREHAFDPQRRGQDDRAGKLE